MALNMLRKSIPFRNSLVSSLTTFRKCHVVEGPKRGWFPAGKWVSEMNHYQQKGVKITAHHITLRSEQPLDKYFMTEALRHLYRKSPPLRACLKTHNENLWMCEMEEELIDFKEIDTKDPLSVIKSQITIPFNPSGPLWRAQFLPQSVVSLPPHKGLHLPHECQIIFYIHHGVCDAATVFSLWGNLEKIIDDMLSEKHIGDEQIGVMGSEKPIELVKHSLMEVVNENIELNKNLHSRCKGSLLLEAYKPPPEKLYSTSFIPKHLDVAETKDFAQRCKKAGVTINSALIAIVNTAIVELVKEHFVKTDCFDISYNVAVDNRRYWKENASDRLGCIIGNLIHGMKTPVNVKLNFWEYARDLHRSLGKSYGEAEHLQQEILRERQQAIDVSSEKQLPEIPPVLTDFHFTNAGDITKLFDNKGSKVEITAVRQYFSMPQLPYTHSHMFHSFHGSLYYILLFSEYYMDNHLANRLGDTVTDLIKNI